MSKYKSAIEKIVVSEATFQNSPEREIEPSWINFFYGNNGSGKTTISRMIRNGQGLTFGNAAQADEFATVVFNRDFIEEELKFDIMPGVVMLSKEASDKQQEIEGKQKEQEQLKGQLQTANDEAGAIQTKRNKLKASLDAAIWKAAARYKKVFGGKGDLSSTARCVQRVCGTTPVERDFNDIKSRYEAATDPNATRYDAAPLQLLDLTKLESVETYSLLGQAIISTADNAYSRFWQNLNAMDWVNTGHTRGLNIPNPPEGKEYRHMGAMESNIFTIAGNRMKGRRACWSIEGGNNLVRLLCLKCTNKLSETLQNLTSLVLPEKYSEEIFTGFSAGKVSKSSGKGYDGFRKAAQSPATLKYKWLREIGSQRSLV